MSLLERLNQDMKTAMKNKEKTKLSVIRMLRSEIKNEEIQRQHTLNDEEVIEVLMRELKKRKDALQQFEEAGRDDLVQQLREEIAVIEPYLPEQLSEEELRELVREVVQETGASSKADIGKVMKAIMPRVKGRADGKLVNRLVQEVLS
ncbi:GatB/YqeY domain-containing protein [Polycladomyces subterraneus]|uniref:GatB/YqeY domain-containing protein n=1 Tax=Polycladomyces subterraneus TaxID=1016997 RepID=A0ABT8IQL2_9BACL|nr:GatB/YqeY domain-containing protein [Polycladomyces subterraneus]MDN4594796.1 GatB/YqeY domain-containing protein [Polycladomyces subterraneus]